MLRLEDDIRFTTTANIALKGFKASFAVECKLLPTDRLREIEAAMQSGAMSAESFVAEFHTGWPEGQVLDAEGNPLPVTPESLAKLRAKPGAVVALVEAFYAGYDRATEGNSEPLLAA